MEQDKGVRRNLAYVGAVTKISKAAIRAFEAMHNKSQGLFTKETVDRYTREETFKGYTEEETVERYTGEGR